MLSRCLPRSMLGKGLHSKLRFWGAGVRLFLSGCHRVPGQAERRRRILNRVFLGAFLSGVALFAGAGATAGAEDGASSLSQPSQIGARIARCWQAPRSSPPQVIEVTVRLSFSRAGAVIGEPRVTYIHAPAEPGFREKIRGSILAAIKACTPLNFAPSLGAGIAGRMLAIKFRWQPPQGMTTSLEAPGTRGSAMGTAQNGHRHSEIEDSAIGPEPRR